MRGRCTNRIAVVAVATCCLVGIADAQVLEAFDDLYGVPFGFTLEVEPFGVLENDILDGENAGESGATASLVTDVDHGTLILNSDGSFSYSIGPGFDGTDSFVYRAEYGAVTSEATVTLSACEGGPEIFTCWDETAYLELVQLLGYTTAQEGFEDDAVWGHIRTPQSAMSVVSHGVEWHSNHVESPAMNPITTSTGPPHSGLWGVYDANHGYATGTPGQCDIDDPPEHCLYYDGISGTRVFGEDPLHGVGGWFTGLYGAKIGIFIDGIGPYEGGHLTYAHEFFGIIDTRPAGFTEFQFQELDGKVGQALYVWADDFTLVGDFPTAVPELEPMGRIMQVTPNPAQGGTTIRLALQDRTKLRLDIYDLSGRLVRSLRNEHRQEGSYAIDWNLRDGTGHRVSSGVYFARLATGGTGGDRVSSHKIVVLE